MPPASGPPSLLSRLTTVALHLLAELVAPTRCAACEAAVAPRVLFCAGCAPSVLPALPPPPGHHAVFDYGGAVATAIVRFKYAGRSDLAARFAALMAAEAAPLVVNATATATATNATATATSEAIDLVVVPVPLHPRRLVERGFDQAALLAGPIARHHGLRYAPRALVRIRETPPQASLDRAARSANVAAAFYCPSPHRIAHHRVLLVDDVRTTGSTLAACAAVLRDAGACEVRTLVLAHRDRPEKVQ